MKILILPLAALVATGALAQAAPQGDAAAGASLYKTGCAACHAITPASGPAKSGPHLAGIAGRKAGAVPGFGYSQAMSNSDVIWTSAELQRFLAGPRQAMPGTRMLAGTLADPQDRADVVAYLKTLR